VAVPWIFTRAPTSGTSSARHIRKSSPRFYIYRHSNDQPIDVMRGACVVSSMCEHHMSWALAHSLGLISVSPIFGFAWVTVCHPGTTCREGLGKCTPGIQPALPRRGWMSTPTSTSAFAPRLLNPGMLSLWNGRCALATVPKHSPNGSSGWRGTIHWCITCIVTL
jgi:hypothetical protein